MTLEEINKLSEEIAEHIERVRPKGTYCSGCYTQEADCAGIIESHLLPILLTEVPK